MGKGDSKKVKELENEVELLKAQLETAGKSGGHALPVTQTQNRGREVK